MFCQCHVYSWYSPVTSIHHLQSIHMLFLPEVSCHAHRAQQLLYWCGSGLPWQSTRHMVDVWCHSARTHSYKPRSLEPYPLSRIPLGRIPVGRIPLGRMPLGRIPISRCPLSRVPFSRTSLIFALDIFARVPRPWLLCFSYTITIHTVA